MEKQLADRITAGEMAPGEVFSAPALAVQFGVSATPVREAMLNLAKRGLVEIVRNKGFRVTEMSRAELEAIVDVRQLLEVPAVGRLAGKLTAPQARKLRRQGQTIVTAAEKGQLGPYLEADLEFHLGLLDLVGNPRLVELVRDLRAQTRLTGLATMLGSRTLEISAQEHPRLVDLLEAGDRQGAERLMHQHIGHVLGWWSGVPEGE
ncbi:GntR family transcriptional regulator [Kineococcus sp. SYSU DK003]|uniref:GntR family transcriptional regulator n=1 Tax=Kineococcus sp. SYSU DK003 TaxID=3383124 RepID=UPI003D7C538A